MLEKKRLSPLLKWAGGKESELEKIVSLVPENYVHYFEPFLGGGALFFALEPENAYLNDASPELMDFYRAVAREDRQMFLFLDVFLAIWDDLTNEVERNREEIAENIFSTLWIKHFCAEQFKESKRFLEKLFTGAENVFETFLIKEALRKADSILDEEKIFSNNETANAFETAVKSAFYMTIRFYYNRFRFPQYASCIRSALFFFIREQCYNSMFRYNGRDEFNIPYGGQTYNRKNIRAKVEKLKGAKIISLLSKATLVTQDFEYFLQEYAPGAYDFLFLDPPYDSEFGTYAKKPFSLEDHERLADYLNYECNADYLLVIKDTPEVRKLYCNDTVTIEECEKTYRVNIQSRNKRSATHLLIRNY